MAQDKVAQIMGEMAGGHLNRDVVAMPMRTIPAFPVRHWVAVASGPYRGWREVVTAISADALPLPSIRLMLDDLGDGAIPPVELDLKAADSMTIKGLPPGDAPWELDVPTPVAV